MDNLTSILIGSMISGIIGLLSFGVSWYVKIRQKRKSYLFKRIHEFEEIIIEILVKGDKSHGVEYNPYDPIYPFLNWKNKVLSSEVFILKLKNERDKGESYFYVKKIRSIFFLNKKYKKISSIISQSIIELCWLLAESHEKTSKFNSDDKRYKILILIHSLLVELIDNFKKISTIINANNYEKKQWKKEINEILKIQKNEYLEKLLKIYKID